MRPSFFVEPILHERICDPSPVAGHSRRRDNARMTEWLIRLGGRVLRLVLVVAGLVFALCILMAGLFVAVLLGSVSLLLGRRPTASWQAVHRARMRAASQMAGRRAEPHRGEVIDIEARELPPSR